MKKTTNKDFFLNNKIHHNLIHQEKDPQKIDTYSFNIPQLHFNRDIDFLQHRSYKKNLKEFKKQELFSATTKHDIFTSFSSFTHFPLFHLTHFQIHKNLTYLRELDLLIYPTKINSLDAYSFYENKYISLTQMMSYTEHTDVQVDNNGNPDGVLCFDSKYFSETELIFNVIGNQSGKGSLVINKESEVNRGFEIPDSSSFCAKNEGKLLISNSMQKNETGFLLEDYINSIRLFNNDIISSNNGGKIKKFSLEKYNTKNTCFDPSALLHSYDDIDCSSPINHFDISKDEKILVCVGDMKNGQLWDYRNKIKISDLKGHWDYGMGCRLQSNNSLNSSNNNMSDNRFNEINFVGRNIVATANQDCSVNLYDLRNTEKSIKTLYGACNAISDVQFIDNNKIVYLEANDHCYIYDLSADTIQDLNFFGYTNGMVINSINSRKYKLMISVVCDGLSGLFEYDSI